MPVTVRKAGVFKPTKQPYTKVGTWRAAKKVFSKKLGAWEEVWPKIPSPPAWAAIWTSFDGAKIVIGTSWAAPVGGHPFDRYIIQLVFRDPTTGALYPQGGIGLDPSVTSYTHTNGASGYQHLAGWKVYVQVWTGKNPTPYHNEFWGGPTESADTTVMQLPVPTAPTSVSTSMASCSLTTSWTHPGHPALQYFQIQIWLWGYAASTYNIAADQRSWAGQPWDPGTIGRNGVSIQVRAVGSGGASAWVYTDGIMPGPVVLTSVHYNSGTLYMLVYYNYDGCHFWSDYWGSPAWVYLGPNGGTDGNGYWVADGNSPGYPRDNSTQRRFVVQPYNTANGWTGRYQGSGYAIKIPSPMYFGPYDTNTWWSIPIPGKWRTNPQADAWFYQGKSISGNSYGTLFYRTQIHDHLNSGRIGYDISLSSWYVYIQRTHTGGLVAAVALNMWLHDRQDDSANAAPGLTDGPQAGPALSRSQQAWVQIPNGWFVHMVTGWAKGITFYVDPGASDNQLRSEIGNVSNRYMILNKPGHAALIDHGGALRDVGTIVIYHGN